MRSKGTKATQGINGEAAMHQRRLHLVQRFAVGPGEVCSYPAHRGEDWKLASGGPVVCGVCHPPARGLKVERVGA